MRYPAVEPGPADAAQPPEPVVDIRPPQDVRRAEDALRLCVAAIAL